MAGRQLCQQNYSRCSGGLDLHDDIWPGCGQAAVAAWTAATPRCHQQSEDTMQLEHQMRNCT